MLMMNGLLAAATSLHPLLLLHRRCYNYSLSTIIGGGEEEEKELMNGRGVDTADDDDKSSEAR